MSDTFDQFLFQKYQESNFKTLQEYRNSIIKSPTIVQLFDEFQNLRP